MVVLIALAVWLALPSPAPAPPPAAERPTNTAPAASAPLKRLETLLPPGYVAGSCTPATTLDGPAVHHDRSRVRRNGKGTYALLEQRLFELQASDLDIGVLLRIHLTPQNIEEMEHFTDQLCKRFLHDDRFEILFKPIARLGSAQDRTLAVLDQAQSDAWTKR